MPKECRDRNRDEKMSFFAMRALRDITSMPQNQRTFMYQWARKRMEQGNIILTMSEADEVEFATDDLGKRTIHNLNTLMKHSCCGACAFLSFVGAVLAYTIRQPAPETGKHKVSH
jgi:hypothetical protein